MLGIAACNIRGVTIHSFAGVGLGQGSSKDLAEKIRKNDNAVSRWLRTKVLIIDEGTALITSSMLLVVNMRLTVSMVDGDLFDKLAEVGSILRGKEEPFGGIKACSQLHDSARSPKLIIHLQLVVTGDFFQLPPVTQGTRQVKFAFEAKLWKATFERTFNLTKVFRQRDQGTFHAMAVVEYQ